MTKQIVIFILVSLLTVGKACADHRAFVVGISNYPTLGEKLANPVTDSAHVAEELKRLGYDVVTVSDPTTAYDDLRKAWIGFLSTVKDGDDIVVFYSGHGVEIGGTDYIVPSDTPRDLSNVTQQVFLKMLYSIPSMISDLNSYAVSSIWILDSCRDKPAFITGKGYSTLASLGLLSGPGSIAILYATGFGQEAIDALPGEPKDGSVMSLFTRYLVPKIHDESDIFIDDIMQRIKIEVSNAAGARDQRPSIYDGLYPVPWCFWKCKPDQGNVEKVSASQVNQVHKIEHCNVFPTGERCTETVSYSKTSILDLLNGFSVVFLGKIGNRGCGESPDRYPFGCDLIANLYKNGVGTWTAADKMATVDTVVYKRAPLSSVGYIAVQNCVVKYLKVGEKVIISGVVAVTTKDEQTAFWGTVANSGDDCIQKSAGK